MDGAVVHERGVIGGGQIHHDEPVELGAGMAGHGDRGVHPDRPVRAVGPVVVAVCPAWSGRPQVLRAPDTRKLSLIVIGTPRSGPAPSESADRAARRAASGQVWTTAARVGSTAVMRSSVAATTSCDDTSPECTSAAIRTAEDNAVSAMGTV